MREGAQRGDQSRTKKNTEQDEPPPNAPPPQRRFYSHTRRCYCRHHDDATMMRPGYDLIRPPHSYTHPPTPQSQNLNYQPGTALHMKEEPRLAETNDEVA